MYLRDHDKYTYLCIDIECESLTPSLIHCAVIQDVYSGEVWTFRPEQMKELREFIVENDARPEVIWVAHNGISYDFPVLNRLLGIDCFHIDKVVDTLTLSYLYHPHLPNGHSLKSYGERFGGGDDGKIVFEDFSKFTEEMLKYCAQDVALTCRVFKVLTKKMLAIGFSELSCEIEHKFRYIMDHQERNGVKFNEKKATILLADLQSQRDKLEASIHEVFPPRLKERGVYKYKTKKGSDEPFASYLRHKEKYPKILFSDSGEYYKAFDYEEFNIGSSKQRVERLLELGWEPKIFTPKGFPKATEEALLPFAEKSKMPEVALMAEHMMLTNRINSLKQWLGQLDDDGRIRGRIITCGASSRRCRHQKPNLAAIIGIEKPYGAELRGLFEADEGEVMTGCDAKSLEGRVLIHYLASKEAEELLMLGDVHQKNCDAINKALGSDVVTRSLAKSLYYAVLYGSGLAKLGSMVGGKVKWGRIVKQTIVDTVPGLAELTQSIQEEFQKSPTNRIRCIDGGYVVVTSDHSSLNYLCQSAGTVFIKYSCILAYGLTVDGHKLKDPWDLNRTKLMLNVHDEQQLTSKPDYAKEAGEVLCRAMTQAGELLGFNIKMEGDYSVGPNWASTH